MPVTVTVTRAGRADAEITFLARARAALTESAPMRCVVFDLRTYVSRWDIDCAVVTLTVRVDFLRRDVDTIVLTNTNPVFWMTTRKT